MEKQSLANMCRIVIIAVSVGWGRRRIIRAIVKGLVDVSAPNAGRFGCRMTWCVGIFWFAAVPSNKVERRLHHIHRNRLGGMRILERKDKDGQRQSRGFYIVGNQWCHGFHLNIRQWKWGWCLIRCFCNWIPSANGEIGNFWGFVVVVVGSSRRRHRRVVIPRVQCDIVVFSNSVMICRPQQVGLSRWWRRRRWWCIVASRNGPVISIAGALIQ